MSAKKELVDLLLRRKSEQHSLPRAVAVRKAGWLRDVNALMGWIEGCLSVLKKKELLDYEKSIVTINEENLGEYEVPSLKIVTPGGRSVKVSPAGTYVVYALGRVDIIAGPRREMLARFDQGEWHIVRPTPDGKRWDSTPLTEESFFNLLKSLLA